MIQFDTFDDGADQHTVLNTLADINEVLKQRFSDSQPQILMVIEKDKGIDFDITPDEEKSACMEAGTHLQSCDDDGFCNECGNQ